MDPYLLTMAGTAGTTVVTLLVGEGWQQARDGVIAVWRRFRPEAADEIGRELETSRAALLQLPTGDDQGSDMQQMEGQWIARFVGLLSEHPQAADELQSLMERLRQGAGQSISGGVRLQARAEGSSRIYQAARDQHITER
ncbi:hypothetical protein EJC51_13325 [Streptomyces aquilus]|uniref:Uncharacterized protein n=1 Tax=Streptomyces aquilus TaxID=2548456 RepID=A0A3Q9BUI3_9ACTN|nr:hypothetical protein [Streptomyces aquilus]AZP17011.1 hypothetical protein EJC51_13325 [Streptomyces aquilus]